MSTQVGEIHFDLDLDHKKFSQGTKAVDRDTDKMSTSLDKARGHSKELMLAMAAAGAAAVAFGVSCVRSFLDSENQIAQTNAVIKSTGGVAGVTAKDVDKLASSLQKSTAFSDEQVRSAANMALTFTGVGKDIFPEVTKTALDMATALNHGVTPSGEEAADTMKLLGKALQDPDAGLGALKRVGVNVDELAKKFTDGMSVQEKQKLILKELSTEFGGSAASAAQTYAGKVQNLKNRFDDLKEQIGKVIVDGLVKVSDWIIKHQDEVKLFAVIVGGVALAWLAWSGAMSLLSLSQAAFVAASAPTIVSLWGINAPLILIELAVAGIVLAIGGFIAALVLLYQKNEWFRNFVDTTWAKIKEVISNAWENSIKPALQGMKEKWDGLVESVKDLLKKHPEIEKFFKFAAISIGMGLIVALIIQMKIFEGIITAIGIGFSMWSKAMVFFNWMYEMGNKVAEVLSRIVRFIGQIGGDVWKSISGGFTNIPGRASGGPVSAAQPYMVGEQGPELFVPQSSGRIVNAKDTAAMSSPSSNGNVYLNIDASGIMATSRSHQRQVISTLIEAANEELIGRGLNPIADNKLRAAV